MLAVNSYGDGVGSDQGDFIPSTLPNAPASISVTAYGANHLDLSWPAPTDTGIGDTSIAITNYKLEVDEGFGNGFVTLSEQTGLTFTHSNLIKGHTYTYRVSA